MNRDLKFGLISSVLNKLDESRWYFGKIVIQKIIYFLQEAKNVNLGYRFTFYHYGPYSKELATDILLMELNDLITSTEDPRRMGYSIHLDKNLAEEYIKKSGKFIKKHEDTINKVIDDFGTDNPSNLELYSTIHFVFKNTKDHTDTSNIKDHVVNKVKNMKPKFSIPEIEKSYDMLKNKKYI